MKVNRIRKSILERFRKNSSWISGESLSSDYNISRVAVWKHVKALQVEGYKIESGYRGYRLSEYGDNLSSLDFNSSEEIHFYRELESTMFVAAQRMQNNKEEPEDFIILADHQLAGLGRDGKSWSSPSGGIYMTCVINRSLPLIEASLIPLRGILTVLQSLQVLKIPNLHFQWPGDIMIQDRKVGGVLEEYYVSRGQIRWYSLGIGLHINDTLEGKDISSVSDVTNINLNRRETVRLLKERWEQNLCLASVDLVRGLSSYARFLHKHVEIRTRSNKIIAGIAMLIDTEGRLCLISDSATIWVSSIESIKLTIGEENNE